MTEIQLAQTETPKSCSKTTRAWKPRALPAFETNPVNVSNIQIHNRIASKQSRGTDECNNLSWPN